MDEILVLGLAQICEMNSFITYPEAYSNVNRKSPPAFIKTFFSTQREEKRTLKASMKHSCYRNCFMQQPIDLKKLVI